VSQRGHAELGDILARADTRIDETGRAQLLQRSSVLRAPLALHIRAKRAAYIGTFVPLQPKPAQIFDHGIDELATAARAIDVFDAQNELPAAGTRTFLRTPKGHGVTKVEETGGRRCNSAAV
jgi:hypothetical protein